MHERSVFSTCPIPSFDRLAHTFQFETGDCGYAWNESGSYIDSYQPEIILGIKFFKWDQQQKPFSKKVTIIDVRFNNPVIDVIATESNDPNRTYSVSL
ncbi:hypothetical protein BCU68_12495 [Vibrio sp. 10N.286.49.B3]|nr:hypothetical protein BCU68_12495 [Vibrio sp. 10N.286.49.B3]